jgi:uncharacterized membrane protein YsdA (DUF1294 family)
VRDFPQLRHGMDRPANEVNLMRYWAWAASGYALVSVVTFVVCGFDKRRSVRGGRRVPDRTLHGFELLGGWPGALVGQAVFHHKRRKLSYMLVFLAIVGLHVALWIAWYRLSL